MSNYFNETKRCSWNINDAFNIFKAKKLDLNVEQQLAKFHDLLKKQDDPLVESWISNWKSFYKKAEKAKMMPTENPTTKINLDMRESVNQNCPLGNLNNYNNKREFDDDDVEQAPQKRVNSGANECNINASNCGGELFDDLFNEDEEDVAVNKTDTEVFKSAVFKAGYQYFKGELSLINIPKLNQLQKGFTPNTLGEYLDMLSYKLLIKEMNTNEKNTLKLSLSHIISFVGPTAAVFEEFFSKQDPTIRNLFEKAKSKVPILPIGMTEKAKQIIDDVLTADGGEDVLRLKISEKKTELLKTAYEAEEMQVLDVVEFVVLCTKRKSFRHTSELSRYRISAHIFDLILNDTSLQVIDGENRSQSTRTAQQDNQKMCSDENDTRRLVGRKIDLIIAKSGVELSSSEWKNDKTTSATIEQQRVKNTRANCAMLKKILSLPIDNASKISIFGMDWLGMVGCMYAIETFDDTFSIHYAGDLVIPESLATLSYLKETLDLLFSFKHHHENLAKTIQPAVEKSKVSDQLRKLRPAITNHMKRELGPVVFFTPTTKHQKKKRTLKNLLILLTNK